MQDWLTLGGRPALVFGAGGLGRASALSLAAAGARVALVDVNEESLNSVVRAAKEAGGDVKPLAAFLASDRARFITGQVLYIDGGRTLV
jgi:gluconate 5-dehydrogenase